MAALDTAFRNDPAAAEPRENRNGMKPGPQNPLGARALYLFQGGKDTLYRLHGTSEAHSMCLPAACAS